MGCPLRHLWLILFLLSGLAGHSYAVESQPQAQLQAQARLPVVPLALGVQARTLVTQARQASEQGRNDSVYWHLAQAEQLLKPYKPGAEMQAVLWQRAEQYRALGKYAMALAQTNRGLQLGLNKALFKNQQAGIYFELNKMDTVLQLIAASENANTGPHAPRLRYLNEWLRASVFLKNNKPADAAKAYRRALGPDTDPSASNVFEVYYKLGNLLYDMGQQQAGLDTLQLSFAAMQHLQTLPTDFDITVYLQKLVLSDKKQQALAVLAWYRKMHSINNSLAIFTKTALLEMTARTANIKLVQNNRRLQDQQSLLRNVAAAILLLASIIIMILMRGVIRTARQNKEQMTVHNNLLIEQRTELQAQKTDLEQLNLTKNMLLSVVTHDIRGPLAGLKMTVELARGNHLSASELQTLLDGLADQVACTETLLNDVLLWAKSQMGGFELRVEPVVLDKEVTAVLMLLGADLKTIQTWPDAGGNAAATVLNKGALQVVLRNILANAIRHNKTGTPIIITYLDTEKEVGISIKDSGQGMPPAALQQLLGRLQAAQAITQHGLGLILVRDFTHLMQGRLEAQTSTEGTTVTVWLPKATSV